MSKKAILDALRADLEKYDKPEYKVDAQRFFKEKLKRRYVLKAPVVRKVSNVHFKKLKELSKKEIFDICETLLNSGRDGERWIGFIWAEKCQDRFEPSDFKLFESWLKKYVGSWASCDTLCCGAMGILLYQYPELVKKTEKWRNSKSRWYKRASAVVLIHSLRRKKQLQTAFTVADILLLDEDDMVQKGYGWMLKEASNEFPVEVFKYVMKNRNQMPRTALRYAIEKYPAAKRKEAMRRD